MKTTFRFITLLVLSVIIGNQLTVLIDMGAKAVVDNYIYTPDEIIDETRVAQKTIPENCAEVKTFRIGLRQHTGYVCFEQGMFLEFLLDDMPDSIYARRVQPVKDSLRSAATIENWGSRGYSHE